MGRRRGAVTLGCVLATRAARPPGTRARPRLLPGLAGAVVVSAAVSAGYQAGYRLIRFPLPSELPTVVATLVALAVIACAAAAFASRRRGLIRAAGWALPALLSTSVQSWLLTGTAFYTNGLGGDQQFRTAFLTRMTDSPALHDAIYADLPPYYSPAWFWVGGRLADATGIPGWEFYKIWSILTLAVSAALAYALWERVVRPRMALVAAMITALVGLHAGAYSPYSWVLIAVAPPLAVLALRTARRILRDGRLDAGACAGIGVYVGLAAITHALLAGVAALYLVVATTVVALRVRRRTHLGLFAQGGAIAVITAVPIAALSWVPYFLASTPLDTDSTAAKFLPEIGAHVPTPVFDATVLGVLGAAGLVWLLLRAARDPVAAALATVTGTAAAWYALSFLAPIVSTTLLAFRLEPLLILALTIAGAFAVRDAAVLSRRRAARPRAAERARLVTAVVAVFTLLATLHVAYQSRTVHPDWDQAARDTPGPDGVIATGTELQRTAAGPSADQISEAIGALTGGRADDELVLLSDVHSLPAFRPYFAFQTVTSAYANPKGGFADRNDLIRTWGGAADGAALADLLDHSPVRAPDVFVLSRTPRGWVYNLAESRLPRDPGDVGQPVVFDPGVFDPAHFAVREVGNIEVIARR